MIQYPAEPLLDDQILEYIVFCMTFSLTLLWGNLGGFSSLRFASICLCNTWSMHHLDSFLFPVWDHCPVA